MKKSRSRCGFSLLEVVLTTSIIGILAAIALGPYGATLKATRSTRLDSDVKIINQSIAVYLASGGSLVGVSEPQAILDKLKTARTAEGDSSFMGFSGSMVDFRLAARISGPMDDERHLPRALWNPGQRRFTVASSGTGVTEFYLESANGVVNYGTEARETSVFSFNIGNGWIWPYSDGNPLERSVPSLVPVRGLPDSGGSEESSLPWGDPVISTLLPPGFSITGGAYPPSTFPISLSLTNPNPTVGTSILVSLDGGPFETYTGTLSVASMTKVVAFVTGDSYLWRPSAMAESSYEAAPPMKLAAPEVHRSHPQFLWSTAETVSVELTNPGDSTISALEYQVDDGDWKAYKESITLAIADYPNGAMIAGRAIPLSVDYETSEENETEVAGPPSPTVLQAPLINPSAPNFEPGTVETIIVALTDRNPTGSVLDYRLNGGGWQTYGASFSITRTVYPSGFTVEARARSTSLAYTDSDVASTSIDVIHNTPSVFAQFCRSGLGEAGATVIGGGVFKLTHSESAVFGDVAIGPNSTWSNSNGAVTGTFLAHAGTTGTMGNVDSQAGSGGTPVVVTRKDLSTLQSEALAISAAAAALTPTRTLGKVSTSMTISATESSGLNVINITEISLSGGAILTFTGGPNDYFVVNISSKVQMSGGSTWALAGTLSPSHVMINMKSGSTDFTGTGGTNVRSGGIILAPHSSKVVLTGASIIEANVISGKEITLTGGSQILPARCN